MGASVPGIYTDFFPLLPAEALAKAGHPLSHSHFPLEFTVYNRFGMMKKIHEWELWDWKSIFVGILVLGGIAVFLIVMFRVPDIMRNQKGKEYDFTTHGQIVTYNEVTYLSQGKRGTRTSVQGIKVTFMYDVDGMHYTNSDLIPQSLANVTFLEKMYKTPQMKVRVKYAGSNPQLSQILLREISSTDTARLCPSCSTQVRRFDYHIDSVKRETK